MAENSSILKAFNIVNESTVMANSGQKTESNNIPLTALSRKALDKLVYSLPADFEEASLRNFLHDLFNWDGKNHVNKILIQAFKDAVNEPMKYPQAVELTGFLVALSPLLEADHIASMYDLVKTTDTAFAPTVYTVNFHSNIKRAFEGLSTERIIKMARSLWLESHRGRWWNMTAGVDNVQLNQADIAPSTLLKSLKRYNENNNMENIIWSPTNQDNFSKYMNRRLDKDLARLSEDFRVSLMTGDPVTPDIAIFLSAVSWLSPAQRPESPINSLTKLLVNIRANNKDFAMPKKPNSIKDMFPAINFQNNGREFMIDDTLLQKVLSQSFINGTTIDKNTLKIIDNKHALAQNAKHMGNCTLTYQKNMEQGKYLLIYFRDDKGTEYNCSFTLYQNRWRIGEINSRYNRGAVPQEIRRKFTKSINDMAPVSQVYQDFVKNHKENKKENYATYVYTVM